MFFQRDLLWSYVLPFSQFNYFLYLEVLSVFFLFFSFFFANSSKTCVICIAATLLFPISIQTFFIVLKFDFLFDNNFLVPLYVIILLDARFLIILPPNLFFTKRIFFTYSNGLLNFDFIVNPIMPKGFKIFTKNLNLSILCFV